MPLLHKKTFVRKNPIANLKATDKVLFCEITQEVFTNYDEFWERLVLLNALVWSCELTGRPNLTYQEALESENKAKKCISTISTALKKPFLYISKYTRRGRIGDVSDDIFSYIRDRYFVGEEVEAIVSKHWYDCKVTKVIMPTEQEILEHKQSLEDSDNEENAEPSSCLVNGIHKTSDDEDDIVVIRDDHSPPKAEVKAPAPTQPVEEEEYPQFAAVKYEVIEIEPWDYKESKHHIVKWDQIRRPKRDFTREKCKMFVKQCLKLCPAGFWVLKESLEKSHGIGDMKYSDIFVGKPPKFEQTILKRLSFSPGIPEKKEKKLSNNINNNNKMPKPNIEKKLVEGQKKKELEMKKKEIEMKKKELETKKKLKPVLTEKEKEDARILEMEIKLQAQKDFQARLEKMRLERKWKKEFEKEERRLMKIYEQDWRQRQEDLEVEDNKDLPQTTPLKCRLPTDYFGDFLMVLDFINTFAVTLELDDVYPNGISYEMLENALTVNEVAGVFNDVVQLLLGALFSLQGEEDEEIEGDTTQDMASMKFEEDLESKCQMAAVKIANQASTWSQQYQGVPLQKAPLDALTMTEILRLHILASGATNVASAFWRHMNRGGYKHTDDPGLQFKLDEPEIIKNLSMGSVFDLSVEEKIKILHILVCQILTYASVRDNIEEKLDKLKEVTNNFRTHKWAASRKEKEELMAKKQKMKDLMEQKKLQAVGNAVDGDKPKVVETEMLEEGEDDHIEKETRASFKNREKAEPQEKDFVDQIERLCKEVRHFTLGQDRAFRRYWLFNTIPGLFVEDRIENQGICCDYPTPLHPVVIPNENPELKKIIKEQALKNLKIINKERDNEKNSSDKENENNDSLVKIGTKTPNSENNLLKTPNSLAKDHLNGDKTPINNISESDSLLNSPMEEEEEEIVDLVTLPPMPVAIDGNIEEQHSKVFGLCSANPVACPVHSRNYVRARWSYYNTTEQLDQLIKSLNPRGTREGYLRNNLERNNEKILNSFGNFESFTFDYSNKEITPNELKKSLKSNLNFAPDTPIYKILELTLRDMILETEEKIDNGMLGRLKVPERDVWRQALVDGTRLSFSYPEDLDWGGKKRLKAQFGLETEEDFGDMEEFVNKDGITEAGVVRELAIAILEVSQSVDAKYIKAPMAESDKLSRKRVKMETRLKNKSKKYKKDADGNEENSSSDEEDEKITVYMPHKINNVLRTPIERWEKSLMACSSYSQLFLHLATLDNSIAWSRSAVLKRHCRVCRRSSDYESMLLCDECDCGYHMACLKPKLTSIPEGDWFCDKCKPKIKPKSPRKRRKTYNEESDDSDNEEGADDEEEEEEEEDEAEVVNQEFCGSCEMGGELICCDTCPKSFHMNCADLRKVPRGDWSCHLCKEKQITTSRKKSSPKSDSSSKKKKLKNDVEIEAQLKRSTKSSNAYEYDDDYSPETSSRRSSNKRSRDPLAELEGLGGDGLHRDTIERMIHFLMNHNESKHFRKPVYRQEVPDYYKKVKKPIDLRTIKNRFNKDKYTSDAEFIADVLLIFQNTQQYYKEDAPEYKSGIKLSKYFISKVKSSNLSSGKSNENEPPYKRRRQS